MKTVVFFAPVNVNVMFFGIIYIDDMGQMLLNTMIMALIFSYSENMAESMGLFLNN